MNNTIFAVAILASASAAQAADMHSEELEAISMVESSGGQNIQHALITKGMHKGTRAGGTFGLMPLTVKALIKGSDRLRAKYGAWLYATNDQITEELNTNHKMDRELASFMWSRLRKAATVEQAACMWYRGPYSLVCQAAIVDSDSYVQKFKSYFEASN